MHFYPGLGLEEVRVMCPQTRHALLCNIDRIKAREALSFMNTVSACFSKDKSYKIALAQQAFAGDDIALATYIETLTRSE